MADGMLTKEEESWLSKFLHPKYGSVDEISHKPSLSDADFANVSSGAVRETMLMLCLGLSLSDGDAAKLERILMKQYAVSLGISIQRFTELRKMSQEYILEQLVDEIAETEGSQKARQSLFALASQMGMTPQEASVIDKRLILRRSLE